MPLAWIVKEVNAYGRVGWLLYRNSRTLQKVKKSPPDIGNNPSEPRGTASETRGRIRQVSQQVVVKIWLYAKCRYSGLDEGACLTVKDIGKPCVQENRRHGYYLKPLGHTFSCMLGFTRTNTQRGRREILPNCDTLLRNRSSRENIRCILDGSGNVVLHRNIVCSPESFLKTIAPFRDNLIVGVECMFIQVLKRRPLQEGKEYWDSFSVTLSI